MQFLYEPTLAVHDKMEPLLYFSSERLPKGEHHTHDEVIL